MIKKIIATGGLGLFMYVIYQGYALKKGVTAGNEGGFIDAAIGNVESEFMKVSNFGDDLNMSISLVGLNHIKGWEGFKADVYLDSAGLKTIGYGHLIKPHESFTTITKAEAALLLAKDLTTAETAVNNAVKVELTQYQYDALVSFVFNVGSGAFARSTLLRNLNNGDYSGVPTQLMRWVNAGGVVVAGLVNRRAADAKLWKGIA